MPHRALVVGDLMLDVFSEGHAGRLSPEAPVPVVLQSTRVYTPGGAGNAAANLAALGDEVTLVAAVGDDPEGLRLRAGLNAAGVKDQALITGNGPTTCKHRVIANGQQVVRLDVEQPAEPELTAACLDQVRRSIGAVDVVLISDYAKGLCTPEVCAEVVRLARALRIPVVVDPKGVDYSRYRGAKLITPNLAELNQATPANLSTLQQKALALVDSLGSAVLVTRSADGMSLFDGHFPELHLPTQARTVLDVTGAGDTVASIVGALLGRGLPLKDACRVANACAGVVVGRRGTSPITSGELLEVWEAELPTEAGVKIPAKS
ncbi:PfkB family carbohydrate kinase [Kineosporia rhizophila]|uniref:bifunctional heptose 7-phosphate kinase/heptose 1-phosphate adenyltransferase n=1 Tax=Kineosporia rhizophila TaxID=84633 RepID=UPI001E477529|nr:PfkB family carbohydrate kinase [Kineosporia rhizophila]MCE0537723.1 PfkB family carbohydrate kinase [Kineosporia rhizophila]